MKTISVLIPARGRLEYLRRSLESLVDLADNTDRVELLVRLDDDDKTADEQRLAVEWYKDVSSTVIVGPRWGYWRMHDYYNQLAAASRGDFLLVWNDDTEILTQGWDTLLCDGDPISIQEIRRDTVETADCTFPVVSRLVYEAVGHLSLNAHVDSWLSDVSTLAGVQIPRDDVVFRHHCLAAEERRLVVDHTLGENGMDDFKKADQIALRQKDAEAILNLIRRSR